MLGILVAELRATPVVTFSHILALRRYITDKYPDISMTQAAILLADAVNKIVEQKIKVFRDEFRPLIKTHLFRMIMKRSHFQINAGDILEASLQVRTDGADLHADLCRWVNQVLRKAIGTEKLSAMLTKLAAAYQQKKGRDLETLAWQIDREGLPQRALLVKKTIPKKVIVPDPPLSPQKTLALAVWESTVLASPEFFGAPLPQTEVPQPQVPLPQAVQAPQLQSAADELHHKGRKARTRHFDLRKALLVGAAAAMITAVLLMLGFLRTLRNDTVFAINGAETVAASRRIKQGDAIAGGERSFDLDVYTGNPKGAAAVTSNQTNTAVPDGSKANLDAAPVANASADQTVNDARILALAATQLNGTANHSSEKSSDLDQNWPDDNDELWMKATAYDLSIASCGKTPQDPLYGITRSGARARFGRTIAVDPKVIPLGSKVLITFPDNYSFLNGVYTAEDTGSAIKGNHIDLFMGEDRPGEQYVYNSALKFGVQKVKLQILRE